MVLGCGQIPTMARLTDFRGYIRLPPPVDRVRLARVLYAMTNLTGQGLEVKDYRLSDISPTEAERSVEQAESAGAGDLFFGDIFDRMVHWWFHVTADGSLFFHRDNRSDFDDHDLAVMLQLLGVVRSLKAGHAIVHAACAAEAWRIRDMRADALLGERFIAKLIDGCPDEALRIARDPEERRMQIGAAAFEYLKDAVSYGEITLFRRALDPEDPGIDIFTLTPAGRTFVSCDELVEEERLGLREFLATLQG
jgi:hypothetical protein